MWTPATREKYSRQALRYQSDLTDQEWRVIEPLLPTPKTRGRPWGWPLREVVNAIFYVMRSGCPWRLLPADFPPWSTVYRWFAAWRDACVFERINHTLVMADRERVGREGSPSAAVIDSQSVKTTEAGGPRGYDAGKKINGRKRHALVDTDGRAVNAGGKLHQQAGVKIHQGLGLALPHHSWSSAARMADLLGRAERSSPEAA